MIQPTVRFVLLLLVAAHPVWAQSPPVLGDLETTPLTYREGDPAVPLTSSIRISSDVPLTRAVVQMTGYVPDEDQLAFSDTEAIRGVVDQADGTLLLLSYPAGSGQPAVNFQNALRQVTYQNTDEIDPDTRERTVSVQVFGGQDEASASVARSLAVVAENDAPVTPLANDDPIDYPAGTGVQIPVFETLTVADGDNELLSSAEVTISTGFRNAEDRLLLPTAPAGIGVTGSGSRTITLFGPASLAIFEEALRNVQFANETPLNVLPTEGVRRVTIQVFDGAAQSVSVSRFVVVGSPEDTPPRIRALTKEVTAGDPLSFTSAEFAERYTDPENDPFTGIFIRSKPERGTLLLRGEEVTNNRINNAGANGLPVAVSEFAALTYQPPSDYVGEDQFLWNAIDGTTFAANSVPVRIVVNPTPLQLTLGNSGPLSASDGQPLPIPPLAFSATQSVPITVTLSVSNGVLSLPAEILPLLTFTSGDGTGDASLVFSGGADAVAYTLSGIRYTPTENYSGNETLSVNASAAGGSSAQTSVAITVVSNVPPTVSDFTLSTVENQAYVFVLTDFSANYTDPDNGPSEGLTEIRLTALPPNGIMVHRGDTLRTANVSSPEGYAISVADVDAGQLRYAPDAGFVGDDEARWNASDGAALATSDAAIQITVLPTLAIVLTQDSATVCSGNPNTLRVVITAGPDQGLTYGWSCSDACEFAPPTNQATVVVSPAETTTYVVTVTDPATDMVAQDTVTVVVTDCSSPTPNLTLDIPNTFTPSGDDINDEWIIGSDGTASPVAVEVFDRYGHSVYRNEAYQDDWNGTYQGQALPEGTYYYLITDADGEVYKGALTILR